MIVSISIFGIAPEQAFSLSIWMHLGTTIAVLIKLRKDYIQIIKSIIPRKFEVEGSDIKKRNWLIYATIGTTITAIPLYFLFKFVMIEGFNATQGDVLTLVISGFLIVTGIVLLTFRRNFGKKTINTVSDREIFKDSTISGLIQGIAILPGISRSGFTVSTILFEKYNQDQSLKLSFLISVPVALASIGMDIIFGEGSVFGTIDIFTILIITLVSFIVGYLSMEVLLKIAQKINFSYFCIFYGVVSFAIIVPFMFLG
jgi:undecaprenyl-diphosphatase